MGKENLYLLSSNYVYIQMKYYKMCKAILEDEFMTPGSWEDCFALYFTQMKQIWWMFSEN